MHSHSHDTTKGAMVGPGSVAAVCGAYGESQGHGTVEGAAIHLGRSWRAWP
jgi:hypothetical protein